MGIDIWVHQNEAWKNTTKFLHLMLNGNISYMENFISLCLKTFNRLSQLVFL